MLRLSCFSLCGCCCCSCCCCCVKTELKTLPCFISPPLMTSLSCPPFSTEQFSLCPPHLEQFYNISFTFPEQDGFWQSNVSSSLSCFPRCIFLQSLDRGGDSDQFQMLKIKIDNLTEVEPVLLQPQILFRTLCVRLSHLHCAKGKLSE